jgi:hypothetical protein
LEPFERRLSASPPAMPATAPPAIASGVRARFAAAATALPAAFAPSAAASRAAAAASAPLSSSGAGSLGVAGARLWLEPFEARFAVPRALVVEARFALEPAPPRLRDVVEFPPVAVLGFARDDADEDVLFADPFDPLEREPPLLLVEPLARFVPPVFRDVLLLLLPWAIPAPP